MATAGVCGGLTVFGWCGARREGELSRSIRRTRQKAHVRAPPSFTFELSKVRVATGEANGLHKAAGDAYDRATDTAARVDDRFTLYRLLLRIPILVLSHPKTLFSCGRIYHRYYRATYYAS